ncbi:MAG: hypothetical protein U1F09_12640 [Steroidobacteraceae bacterium]
MSAAHPRPDGCVDACHGCRHRDLDDAASLAQKSAYLARVLAPWNSLIEPVRAADRRIGYRDRVTLTTKADASGRWQFGLMRRDELIAIPDCPVHGERVRGLVHLLREHLPGPDSFPLAYLHVAGPQATLIVKARDVPLAVGAEFASGLERAGIEGLWVHGHPAAGRRLFARSGWRLAWGRGESHDAHGLVHGPTAFLQAMPVLHRASLDAASAYLGTGPGVAVLDLYCGLGAALRSWTVAGSPALGIELSGEAVACAARNAPTARLLRGTCAQRLPQVRDWWAGHADLMRVAYVNPPRSGLEQEVLAALVDELRPERIAYLSCSAGTLARDLARAELAGYRVDSIQPLDFFPNTHHVEALALLRRA